MRKIHTPVVLSIAGSDSSCGAGAQADLKTFGAMGCHGVTAITCIVAEVPMHVRSIQAVSLKLVRDQLDVLDSTYPIAAIKTGMLFSIAIIRLVAEKLQTMKQPTPLVIDPVMMASSGDLLIASGAIEAYKKFLFPLATLITPNQNELKVLSGKPVTSLHTMRLAGKLLMQEIGVPILLKGGHLKRDIATDILLTLDGKEEIHEAPFVKNIATHGTGCAYSAAIAAGLAQGKSLNKAVRCAKKFITRAIVDSFGWGNVSALDQIQYKKKR